MAFPSLNGPHFLSIKIVDQTLRRKVPGVYVLSAKEGEVISTRRVGRADDLATTIKEFVGLYSHFSCAYTSSPRNAYEMECELQHAMKPPENPKHPAKPPGSDWVCPECGQ